MASNRGRVGALEVGAKLETDENWVKLADGNTMAEMIEGGGCGGKSQLKTQSKTRTKAKPAKPMVGGVRVDPETWPTVMEPGEMEIRV